MASNKYYIFIDECGDQSLTNIDIHFPVFTLCGVIVSSERLKLLNNAAKQIKIKYTGNTDLIFHSRDIRKCERGFEFLFDNKIRKSFYDDINKLLTIEDAYSIVSCSTLKYPYIGKFGTANDIYAESLEYILGKCLEKLEGKEVDSLQIILEIRGKREDKKLRFFYEKLTTKQSFSKLKEYNAEFLFSPKKDNILGLQIADLVAYPITRYVLEPDKTNLSYEVIKRLIYHSGIKP